MVKYCSFDLARMGGVMGEPAVDREQVVGWCRCCFWSRRVVDYTDRLYWGEFILCVRAIHR